MDNDIVVCLQRQCYRRYIIGTPAGPLTVIFEWGPRPVPRCLLSKLNICPGRAVMCDVYSRTPPNGSRPCDWEHISYPRVFSNDVPLGTRVKTVDWLPFLWVTVNYRWRSLAMELSWQPGKGGMSILMAVVMKMMMMIHWQQWRHYTPRAFYICYGCGTIFGGFSRGFIAISTLLGTSCEVPVISLCGTFPFQQNADRHFRM